MKPTKKAAAKNDDVRLSTGRVITHERLPNGSIAATVEGADKDALMTNEEWDEYANIIKARRASSLKP